MRIKSILVVSGLFALLGIVGRMDYDDALAKKEASAKHVAWLQHCQTRGISLEKCPAPGQVVASK